MPERVSIFLDYDLKTNLRRKSVPDADSAGLIKTGRERREPRNLEIISFIRRLIRRKHDEPRGNAQSKNKR